MNIDKRLMEDFLDFISHETDSDLERYMDDPELLNELITSCQNYFDGFSISLTINPHGHIDYQFIERN